MGVGDEFHWSGERETFGLDGVAHIGVGRGEVEQGGRTAPDVAAFDDCVEVAEGREPKPFHEADRGGVESRPISLSDGEGGRIEVNRDAVGDCLIEFLTGCISQFNVKIGLFDIVERGSGRRDEGHEVRRSEPLVGHGSLDREVDVGLKCVGQ